MSKCKKYSGIKKRKSGHHFDVKVTQNLALKRVKKINEAGDLLFGISTTTPKNIRRNHELLKKLKIPVTREILTIRDPKENYIRKETQVSEAVKPLFKKDLLANVESIKDIIQKADNAKLFIDLESSALGIDKTGKVKVADKCYITPFTKLNKEFHSNKKWFFNFVERKYGKNFAEKFKKKFADANS